MRADGGRSRISPAFIAGTSGGGGSDGAGLSLIFFVVHVKSNPNIFIFFQDNLTLVMLINDIVVWEVFWKKEKSMAGYVVIMSNNAWYIL